ncbi:MAG: hypothetical protein JRG89_01730, partial [Deltaproteobacteria bacterium]|nr:hypothetical protein [Deltaproteobacteria bacterium]
MKQTNRALSRHRIAAKWSGLLLASSLVFTFVFAMSLTTVASGASAERTKRKDPSIDLDLPKEAIADESESTAHLKARLLVDPDGESARIGVLFDLEPGWHLYWRNPGDTGLAPELHWRVDGGRVGKARWPAPHRFDGLGTDLASFGYSEQVLLASELAGYDAVETVGVDADLLICENECIPVEFSLSRPRPDPTDASQRVRERAIFDRYAAQVPRTPISVNVVLEMRYSRSALRAGDDFEGAIVIESCRRASPGCIPLVASDEHAFIPDLETDEALAFEFQQPIPHPERPGVSLLRFRGAVEPDIDNPLTRLAGVLSVRDPTGARQALEIDLPFPGAPAHAESSDLGPGWLTTPGGDTRPSTITTRNAAVAIQGAAAATGGPISGLQLLRVIALALLGGLILNGMPCVLPVLGIKICSAAELAQQNPGELRRHGFAYLAGVLASMAVLAGAVLFLKAAGA